MTNIAEILKDCPKGTKLYSPICGECELDSLHACETIIEINYNSHEYKKGVLTFDKYGRWEIDGECLLFPSKDNRDWSKFNKQKFKKGDFVVSLYGTIGILSGEKGAEYNVDMCFCALTTNTGRFMLGHYFQCDRLATEEEKRKLLKAIDKNGYVWDEEKLELYKKLQFNKGEQMEKEIKIDVPEGYVINEENSTFECIKLKKKEPIQWRNSNKMIGGFWINENSEICENGVNLTNSKKENRNVFATEKHAKSALAIAQISQIIANDERLGGPITDFEWNNYETCKYVILRHGDDIVCTEYCGIRYHLLAFHTGEQRDLFFKENEDLVRDYFMLG